MENTEDLTKSILERFMKGTKKEKKKDESMARMIKMPLIAGSMLGLGYVLSKIDSKALSWPKSIILWVVTATSQFF